MAFVADLAYPKGHHLHVAASAGSGNGVLAKVALILDQAEHELRVESGARRFVLHAHQEIASGWPVRHSGGKTRRHVCEPGPPFDVGGEHEARRRIVAHRAMKRILHVGGEALLELSAGDRSPRSDHE